MLVTIPWDVWAAAALAAVLALLGIFGPTLATFIALYVSMCTWVILEIFFSEIGGAASTPRRDPHNKRWSG